MDSVKTRSPYDWTNNISGSKEDIWTEEDSGTYCKYVITHALSCYYDCAMLASVMDQYPDIPEKMHYDFLRLSVSPKKKRFAKWHKPEKDEAVEFLGEWFGISRSKARQFLKLISGEDLQKLQNSYDTGGRKK